MVSIHISNSTNYPSITFYIILVKLQSQDIFPNHGICSRCKVVIQGCTVTTVIK